MRAFNTIKPKSGSAAPLFLFGDHASARIPDTYKNLGLSGDDLTRHIAVDIGTDSLIRDLCARFGCAGHLAAVSRLVIDCHRDPDAAGLIPPISDGTHIPGNSNITPAERARRIADIHAPYHGGLTVALDAVTARAVDPLIVSVHSFTPQLKTGGPRRTLDIGLLCKGDMQSAQAMRDILRAQNPDMQIELNRPYSAFEYYYTVDVQVMPRGLRHLVFEIRQDLIDTDLKIGVISGVLENALRALI